MFITPFRYLHLLNSAFFRKKGPSAKLKGKTSGKTLIKLVIKAWFDFFKMIPRMLKKRTRINRIKKISKIDNEEIKKWFKEYEADLETMIYK